MQLPTIIHNYQAIKGGGKISSGSGDQGDLFSDSLKGSDSSGDVKPTNTKRKRNKFLESDESDNNKSIEGEF